MDGGRRGMQEGRLLADLRAATREQHAALDAMVGPEIARSAATYARFLRASLVAAAPVEEAVERVLGAEFPALRGAALRADLAELGEAPSATATAFSLADEAEGIGAAYVLEGSALGGMVLATKVREALGAHVPARYLQLRGPETSARWRWFLEKLRGLDANGCEASVANACAAASQVFEAYRASYRQHADREGGRG